MRTAAMSARGSASQTRSGNLTLGSVNTPPRLCTKIAASSGCTRRMRTSLRQLEAVTPAAYGRPS
jgi:hypothetical protein